MKIYKSNEIKNIALLGSKGSGKTTLAEAMLYECGVIKRRGTIDAKNTVSDYFPVEKEYGYSVFSTIFYAEFLGKKLNVIDCPGADDFVGAAITALNVTDTGVIVINGQYGVEVGTQNIFRTATSVNKPIMFALNQLDGEKADYENVFEQMREVFGPKVVAIQYPLASGPGFNSRHRRNPRRRAGTRPRTSPNTCRGRRGKRREPDGKILRERPSYRRRTAHGHT